MAEWICRTLRDGGLEGEHAPALAISDTINCPLGTLTFDHVLSQLSSFIFFQKCQSSGLLLVALSRSPLYYAQLLKRKGYGAVSSNTWFKVLDCYTDPLGWKGKIMETGAIRNMHPGSSTTAKLCKNVGDVEKLMAQILELGRELSEDGKGRFVVAFDSVSELLRHMTISSVAALLSKLRSNDRVSSLFWLFHSDLHETPVTAAIEYLSSMKATIDPTVPLVDQQGGSSENLSAMEQNLRRAKFCVRVKRRNGRVRMMVEELYVEKSGIKFTSVSSEADVAAQNLVPKVQFNLQLTEKERNDRAKVVLPFEHQGNGKTIQIYDGRKSLSEDGNDTNLQQHSVVENSDSSKGEIIYFRDSDDEMPDSDEDPDDDLDI
ncbi:elongator complex protein 5 [Andrographis paniculata]|uniref:elongator complex protein 5 n=1 Tax=Andrographis paniculata TaxID=175694 RepID=UPI0021E7C66F|nr:elongator complex protein 5 [Andrographis paniculata]